MFQCIQVVAIAPESEAVPTLVRLARDSRSSIRITNHPSAAMIEVFHVQSFQLLYDDSTSGHAYEAVTMTCSRLSIVIQVLVNAPSTPLHFRLSRIQQGICVA